MTVRRVRLKGTVAGRADASSLLQIPGDVVLVERGRPRLLVMACPCGCGEQIPVNLDPRSGPAWRYYPMRKSGISLFPSVWRGSGCRSHFIIWRDQIWLFGHTDDSSEVERELNDEAPSHEVVLEKLPKSVLVHFAVIAEQLGAVPWDVQSICQHLVRRGLAIEGRDKQRGCFRRSSVRS